MKGTIKTEHIRKAKITRPSEKDKKLGLFILVKTIITAFKKTAQLRHVKLSTNLSRPIDLEPLIKI